MMTQETISPQPAVDPIYGGIGLRGRADEITANSSLAKRTAPKKKLPLQWERPAAQNEFTTGDSRSFICRAIVKWW